jgi:hypothetical protein
MSRKKLLVFLLIAAAAIVGVVLLVPDLGLARAGGGDRFPDGGGGGGGGDGGGGDGGAIFYIIWAIFRLLPFPLNVIVVILVIVGFYLARRKKVARGGGQVFAPPARPVIMPAPVITPDLAGQFDELKKRDPSFSEQSFEDMASTAFFKIQEAWSKKDMGIARSFVSPALLGRFEAQIAEFKKMGRTNVMEQLTIGALDLVEAVHDGGYDYVTARVNAAAADYTVDDKSGQLVGGSKEIKSFTEYWTFLRSDQVKTDPNREMMVSKHCPNCGAPASVNAVGKCDYCGSELTSGQFSWVLSEITQGSAWRPRAQAARPAQISPLAGGRYVLGLVQCPSCGANVQDIAGVTTERCWRCGAAAPTEK